MDLYFDVTLKASPDMVFPFIDDLSRYPQWMPLLHEVTSDGDDAWNVELRAKVGPFARSKRLRMIRSEHTATERAVFVRADNDGRQHSQWKLQADVLPTSDGGSHVTMWLHYGGSLWGGVLERVLADQVQRGRENLRHLVDD